MTQHPIRQNYELSGRRRMQISEFGYNFRIHPLAAVIANAELERCEERRQHRAAFYERLGQALKDVPGIRPANCAPSCKHAYYRYCPTYVSEELADGKISRDVYLTALAAEGVPVAEDPIGVPLHRRRFGPNFKQRQKQARCPVAEERCERTGLSLGTWLPEAGGDELIELLRAAFCKVAARADELFRVPRLDLTSDTGCRMAKEIISGGK